MCDYVERLRNSRRRVVKPAKVGKPPIRHVPKVDPTKPNPVDWRFETVIRQGHFVNEDGVVYMFDEFMRELR